MPLNLFLVAVNKSLKPIRHEDIFYFESDNYLCKVRVKTEYYYTHHLLTALEKVFCNKHFCRVHRRYIVNLKAISHISKDTIFINGIEIPIGKHYKSDLLSRFDR